MHINIDHVHLVKMGGTIEFFDPDYDMIKDLMKLDSTIDNQLNSIIKPHFGWSAETITQKDSREITSDDRKRLKDAIIKTDYKNIIVTHGTFTMVETAKYLEGYDFSEKKIIITGSMIPLAGFTTADAGFNLGFAIASFSGINPGVYLTMNGGLFQADEVIKNRKLFRFEQMV